MQRRVYKSFDDETAGCSYSNVEGNDGGGAAAADRVFCYASVVAYKNIHKTADERIGRSLEVLQEQTRNIFQSAVFAIGVADQLIEGMTNSDIKSNETSLHNKLKTLDTASNSPTRLIRVTRRSKCCS